MGKKQLQIGQRVRLARAATRQGFPQREGIVESRSRALPHCVLVRWDGRKTQERWSEALLSAAALTTTPTGEATRDDA